MITPKNLVGTRKVGLFSNNKRLSPKLNSSSLKKWTLSNSLVSFNFIEDPSTGVRLDSWKPAGGQTVYNKSRNLWQINTINNYGIESTTLNVHIEHGTVYPTHRNFTQPSQIPIETNQSRTFSFVWTNINYDIKRPSFKCVAVVTATLPNNSSTIDISVSLYSTQSYTASDLLLENSSVLTSIHFPSIIIAKDEDEEVNDDFILSAPISVGYTYYNPFRYLRAPRFDEESYQYSDANDRCYSAGFIGYPISSRYKYNYGNPGGMSMPALVIGNKTQKQGTLIYGMDREGTNPKGFQWYSDGDNLHINIYHNSDDQLDPYGLGGYYINGVPFTTFNIPTWSVRIRPFISESTWIDWKGFSIYKEEAVPEQEEHGWMPKSLYERKLSGEITAKAAEMPLVLNLFGFTTGELDNMERSLDYYKTIYKECVNPNLEDPYIPIHYQCYNADPKKDISGDPNSTYNGWFPWAGSGYALIGPHVFKSPDYYVNDKHKVAYSGIFDSNGILYSYDLFSFIITTGSVWTNTYSGIDLASKSIFNEDRTYVNDDYASYAASGVQIGIFNFDTFNACFSPEVCRNQNKTYKKELYKSKMGTYNDTLGNFGRGCFGKHHTYYDPDLNSNVEVTHPRAGFSKYFNDLQIGWIEDQKEMMKEAHAEEGLTSIPVNDWVLASGPEFPNDVLLKNTPLGPIYEPVGPILNQFVNSFSNPRSDAILNLSPLGSTVDGLSDTDIGTLLNSYPGISYWLSYIKYPNWIQRCPAYQIVYSDRAIFYEWVAVYATNVFDFFFNGDVITGVGSYNQNLTRPKTQEEKEMSWAAFAGLMWPYANRFSAWHLDSQYSFFNPAFSSIEDDEAVVHSSSNWSGLFNNFNKVQLRLQAYCPDYIYHGSIEHPLETWESNYISDQLTDNFISIKSSLTNCLNPHTGNVGLETTPHFVRKDINGNYLVAVYNWYSGVSQFSSVFDPVKYGIQNGYQVYSLDLTSALHGTKTLTDIKNPTEILNINVNLDKYDFALFMIEVDSTSLDGTAFSDLISDYVNIRYGYGQQVVTSNDFTLTYSYTPINTESVSDPIVGSLAPATQQILNNLPQWSQIRQDKTSNGWKLTNAWGLSFENVINNVSSSIQNNYLITSDSTLLNKLSYIDVNNKELLENRKRNLLFNSSFEIKDTVSFSGPAGWINYLRDPLVLNYQQGGITPVCIRSTGISRLGQTVYLDNITVNSLTGSVYFKSNAPNTSAKLIISVEKIDGTSIIEQAVISTPSTEWIRLVLPINVYAQVYKVNFIIKTDCSSEVCISAPQLEIGSITNWSASNIDFTKYLPYNSRFNSVFAVGEDYHSYKIPLRYIGEEKEFLKADIPTRVEKTFRPAKNLNLYTDKKVGRVVSFHNEIFTTEYVIEDGKIKQRSSNNQWDVYGSYDLRDLRYYEELTYGTKEVSDNTIVPLAIASRKEWLFIACKETIKNSTLRTLKIVKPIITPNGETYLESICDFNLDLNFDSIYGLNQIEEEISEIYLSDIDPSYLIISTTNNVKKYYKLYFDYYYFNPVNNRLYTIEQYSNHKIHII